MKRRLPVLPRWGCLVLLLWAALSGSAGALDRRALSQYLRDSWSTGHGLPHATAGAVAQTGDGYLWVGTGEGLARFDGVRFTVFGQEAVGFAHVSALAAAADGGLWIAGPPGRLARLGGGRFESRDLPADAPAAAIVNLLDDGRGNLWAGFRGGGLRRASRGRWDSPAGLRDLTVNALCLSGESLWIASTTGLVQADLEGRLVARYAEPHLPDPWVVAAGADGRGGVWAATRDGALVHLGPGGALAQVAPARALAITGESRLLTDRDGNIWLATYGNGLFRLQDGRLEGMGEAQGFPGVLTALAEDAEGNLWVGTYADGLVRLRDSSAIAYTQEQGLSHATVKTVLADAEGAVWAGTYGGGLDRLDPASGRIESFGREAGLPDPMVRTLLEGRPGDLWVGTLTGVARRRGRRFETVLANQPVAINSLAEDEGALVAASFGRGLLRLGGPASRTLTRSDGLPTDQLGPLLRTRDGALWIGTYGAGLCRLHDGRLTTVGGADTPLASVLGLHEDAAGALWIGTANGGLARLREGRLSYLNASRGLVDGLVFEMVEDRHGFAWITTSHGVFRAAKGELDEVADGRLERASPRRFGASDGLPSETCSGGSQPAAVLAPDGRLWIATLKGLAVIDPARVRSNPRPPPVHVEGMSVDGRPAALPGGLAVPPGGTTFEFRYAALSFRDPGRVAFRYRLEGYDEGWVEAGSRRAAYYTRLPHGEYRFRVLAANEDGLWNEQGAAFAFSVRPRAHETPWFRAAAFLAFAAALYGVHRLRVWRLQARERALQALVDERTRDLRETLQLKDEVVSIVAHDFRSPLGVIKGYAERLSGTARESETRRLLDVIAGEARRLAALAEDTLTMSRIEAGHFALDRRPLRLLETVQQVVETRRAASADALSIDAPEDLVVQADSLRVHQVVDNIVGNAVKYSPPGASVGIEIRREGPAARVSVADHGPGIPAQELPRLFQKFSRLEGARRSGISGTGLGLYICRAIVEAHGGRIWAESVLGQGTTFHFTLPLAAEGETAAAVAARPRSFVLAPGQGPVRALVADDVAENRALLRDLLEAAGLEVREAADGALAVETWDLWRPQIVLMDVRMPVMDGEEASRRIRHRDTERRTRIIVLTASAFPGEHARIRASGADAVLTKPFEAADLFEAMAAQLQVEFTAVAAGPGEPGGLPPSLAGIDVRAGLACAGGNVALYRGLAQRLRTDLEGWVPRLAALQSRRDARGLADELHRVKGTSSMLGAFRVSEAAAALERALQDTPGEELRFEEAAAAVEEMCASCRLIAEVEGPSAPTGDAPLEPARAEAARKVVRALARDLAENNLRALETFAQLQAALAPSRGPQLRELDACLQRLDFAAASAALAALEASLEASEP